MAKSFVDETNVAAVDYVKNRDFGKHRENSERHLYLIDLYTELLILLLSKFESMNLCDISDFLATANKLSSGFTVLKDLQQQLTPNRLNITVKNVIVLEKMCLDSILYIHTIK